MPFANGVLCQKTELVKVLLKEKISEIITFEAPHLGGTISWQRTRYFFKNVAGATLFAVSSTTPLSFTLTIAIRPFCCERSRSTTKIIALVLFSYTALEPISHYRMLGVPCLVFWRWISAKFCFLLSSSACDSLTSQVLFMKCPRRRKRALRGLAETVLKLEDLNTDVFEMNNRENKLPRVDVSNF